MGELYLQTSWEMLRETGPAVDFDKGLLRFFAHRRFPERFRPLDERSSRDAADHRRYAPEYGC